MVRSKIYILSPDPTLTCHVQMEKMDPECEFFPPVRVALCSIRTENAKKNNLKRGGGGF